MEKSQKGLLSTILASTSIWQRIVIFGAILVLGVVIFLALSFSEKTKQSSEVINAASHVKITNLKDVAPEMPEFYDMEVRSLIYRTLVDYNGINENSKIIANIRDGSYIETSSGDFNNSSFIVDIPDLKKSFKIDFDWQPNNNPDEYDIIIDCPAYEDQIYDDRDCAVSDNLVDNLTKYLPIKLETDPPIVLSELVYSEYSEENLEGKAYLMVDIGGCEDDSKRNAAEKIVKEWLEEHKVDSSRIYIEYGFTNAICR